jgi:hypothetical protein
LNKKTKIITGTAIAGAGAGVILIPQLISAYGKAKNKKVTMQEFMRVINEVYGINLSGISSLKHSRVSLYAKGQWILQHKTDLFVVHTGEGDKDIKIYPTKYFTEKTGLTDLPFELQENLLNLGMFYQEKDRAFYFKNPKDEAISDIFLGKTLKAVTNVIQNSYAIL